MTLTKTRRSGFGVAVLALLGVLATPPDAGAAVRIQRLDIEGRLGYAWSLSANGRYLAYAAALAGQAPQVRVLDLRTGRSELVSATPAGRPGGGRSTDPSISADGRYVAFVSDADDLVRGVGDATSPTQNVFVRDRVTRRTTRVNVDVRGRAILEWNGRPAAADRPLISADGRKVVFRTEGNVMHDGSVGGWFAVDRVTRRVTALTHTALKTTIPATVTGLSANGRYAVYATDARVVPADTDDDMDVYRVDTVTGQVTLVSAVPLRPVSWAPPGTTAPAYPLGEGSAAYDGAAIDASGSRVAFVETRTANRQQLDYPAPLQGTTLDVGSTVVGAALVVVDLARRVTYVPYRRSFLPVPAVGVGRAAINSMAFAAGGTAVVWGAPEPDMTAVDDDYTVPDPAERSAFYRAPVANAPAATTLAAQADCPKCSTWIQIAYYDAPYVRTSQDGSVTLVETLIPLLGDDTDTESPDLYLVTAPR